MASLYTVKQFAAGSCYSYVVSSQGLCLVLDPHISLLNDYIKYCAQQKLTIQFIVDTHTHADHFSLAAVLKKKFSVPVLMHEKAVSQVADARLKDNDVITVGNAHLKVMYTPGHTDDAISLYVQGALFTGDVLLIGSVGRTDFQNGSPESMFDTLQKIKTLPDNTKVYPGHDYHQKLFSMLGVEKNSNPFLKAVDKTVFVSEMRAKKLAKPFNMDNVVRVNQTGQAAELEMISPKDVHARKAKETDLEFLDVRSFFEYNQMHIKGSLNIPLDILQFRLEELSKSQKSFIVLCRTGNRSPMAADMLIQAGIQGVSVMDGGLTAWRKAGLPVEKGQGGISLERQVRLIAGSLILSGIILSWLVHGAFIFISVFVGCGLIFAGLTDNCFTGMLLMKLPYNKKLYKTKSGGGTCAMG